MLVIFYVMFCHVNYIATCFGMESISDLLCQGISCDMLYHGNYVVTYCIIECVSDILCHVLSC